MIVTGVLTDAKAVRRTRRQAKDFEPEENSQRIVFDDDEEEIPNSQDTRRRKNPSKTVIKI